MHSSLVIGVLVAALIPVSSSQSSSMRTGSYTVSLSSDAASIIVAGGTSPTPTTYQLGQALRELRHGGLSPNGRLTIVGRGEDEELVVVLAPEAGTLLGTVRGGSAAISADGRFAVWARRSSGNAAASAEYYVATVDELPTPPSHAPAVLPGRLLYPGPGSGLHVLASTIERVDDSTFAFLDFSQHAQATRVMVVKLSDNQPPVVVARPLNPTDFAQMSGATSARPGKPALSRIDAEGLSLKIDFAPVSADAQGRTATIRMW